MKTVKTLFANASANHLVLIICINIFFSALTVMFVLGALPKISYWSEALLYSSLLLITVFPTIYLFAFNPLRARLAEANQLAEQFRNSEARYRLLVNSINAALITADTAGNIVGWNTTAERIFGYPESEVLGQPLTLLLPARFHDAHRAGLARVVAGGARRAIGKTLELDGRRKDGSEFPLELSLSEWQVADQLFFTGIAHDITERKAAALELLETNRHLEAATERANLMAVQAEAANIAKSEFLAVMSHEIRTPLNGVIGMTLLLLDTPLTAEQRDYAETVKTSGESLLALLNDVLDYSKIESGKLDLDLYDFDPRALFEDLADVMSVRAQEKGLEFNIVVDARLPARLRGDADRLRQILLNLTSNAIKFTATGEIAIEVGLAGPVSPTGPIGLRFEVRDTGIGIPADRVNRLFQPFSQVDTSTTRRYGGTGLGLAISRKLAELMGGQIGVTSVTGTGSTFWFTVCLEPASELPPPEVLWTWPKPLAILSVDDNATNRRVLRQLLTSTGCQYAEAVGGAEALAQLRQAQQAGTPFHVALVDMEMPEMDGTQLCDIIHADPALSNLKLILLTSRWHNSRQDLVGPHGFAAVLTKPVRCLYLLETLKAVLTGRSATAAAVASQNCPTTGKRAGRILLAEDNPTNQKVALAMLARMGATTDVAENGRVALRMFLKQPYDLILMDVEMPVLDGIAATRRLRALARRHPAAGAVPIVAMTAHAIKGFKERCLEAGMNDYIVKPIDPRELSALLQHYLTAPAPAAAPVVFDETGLRERIGSDDGLIRELIATYVCDVGARLDSVETALQTGDVTTVRLQAHTLKGSSGSVGMVEMQRLSAQLEDLVQQNNLAGAQAAIPELRAALARVQACRRPAGGPA